MDAEITQVGETSAPAETRAAAPALALGRGPDHVPADSDGRGACRRGLPDRAICGRSLVLGRRGGTGPQHPRADGASCSGRSSWIRRRRRCSCWQSAGYSGCWEDRNSRCPFRSCGPCTLGLFALLARRVCHTPWALIAVAPFAFADRLIFHATEVKPYGTDVFVAVLLMWIAVGPLPGMRAAPAGVARGGRHGDGLVLLSGRARLRRPQPGTDARPLS